MSDQHPGVEDEVERALRLGLATASQMADRFARARQDLARQAQYRNQQEARQLEARDRAEGASATARLAVVDRTEWWDRATPADITSMWHLAAQWQDEQPQAAIAAEAIARQVQDRYDIDVRAPGIDAGTVRAASTRLSEEQSDSAGRPRDLDETATALEAVLRADQRDGALAEQADDSQQRAQGGEVGEEPNVNRATLLELEADEHAPPTGAGGTSALHQGELGAPPDARTQASADRSGASATLAQGGSNAAAPYDSVERREQTASRLRESGLPADLVAVAIRADVAHARPAAEAVKARATTSRSAGTRGVARDPLRPDRGR